MAPIRFTSKEHLCEPTRRHSNTHTHKCAEIIAFELQCWRRLLRFPWKARRSNQSILKEINPEYSLEGLMLRLKFQYLATWYKELTHWKRLWCWEGLGPGGAGDRDKTVGWHHWLNGHESEETLEDSEGQGSLACYSPWDHRESDTTERLNNNNNNYNSNSKFMLMGEVVNQLIKWTLYGELNIPGIHCNMIIN